MRTLPKILLLSALAVMPLAAATLPVITLEDAIESAVENNIGLQSSAVSLAMTMRNENNYVSDYLPSLTLRAEAGTGYDFNSSTFSGFTISPTVSASFSYSLDGSKITDGESRRLSKEEASLSYESDYNELVSEVTSAYWTLSTYDSAITNAESAYDTARSSYESTKAMYDSGLSDELTMLKMEMALQKAEIDLETAMNDKALALASFMALTGLEGDFQTEALPETVFLSLPSAEDLMAEYGEGTAAIRSARNTLAAAQNAESTAALGQYMPVVSAEVSYTYNGSYGSKANRYSTKANNLEGSVSVTIPISSYIPGSAADSTRKDRKDTVTIASLGLQSTQNALLDGLRSTIISIEQMQGTIRMTEKNVEIAERTYALAEEKYEAGLSTADELSSSRDDLLVAQNSLLELRLGHLNASYALADTLGIELQDLQAEYPLMEKETE